MRVSTTSIFGGRRPSESCHRTLSSPPAELVHALAVPLDDGSALPLPIQPVRDVDAVSAAASRSNPQRSVAASVVPAEVEGRLLAILDAPLEVYESAHLGFARKERELGELFATLPARVSQALHGRLSGGATGDPLATKFARLTSERRARLLHFLSLAPRREALVNAGLRAR